MPLFVPSALLVLPHLTRAPVTIPAFQMRKLRLHWSRTVTNHPNSPSSEGVPQTWNPQFFCCVLFYRASPRDTAPVCQELGSSDVRGLSVLKLGKSLANWMRWSPSHSHMPRVTQLVHMGGRIQSHPFPEPKSPTFTYSASPPIPNPISGCF